MLVGERNGLPPPTSIGGPFRSRHKYMHQEIHSHEGCEKCLQIPAYMRKIEVEDSPLAMLFKPLKENLESFQHPHAEWDVCPECGSV